MSLHHTADSACLLCEYKLTQAHSRLGDWFHKVKATYPNVHVSWSYRNQEDQEKAYMDGKSELHYPNSAHNKADPDGRPCALALDLFQLDEDGVARFAPLFYAKLAQECVDRGDPIQWGGTFKSLGDRDHYQLNVGE